MFEEMAHEEVKHRGMLYDLYRTKFGEYLPLIRRHDVKGFVRHKPLWLVRPLGLDEVRKYAAEMEFETARFYRKAAEQARDASVRELLIQLAEAEDKHETLAEALDEKILTPRARAKEDETARRMFVLQYVQPGLAGLMDGSVSTLAPLFAAAFATHDTWRPSWSGSPPPSAREFPWPLPRPCPMTARSPGAARRCCAGSPVAP